MRSLPRGSCVWPGWGDSRRPDPLVGKLGAEGERVNSGAVRRSGGAPNGPIGATPPFVILRLSELDWPDVVIRVAGHIVVF